MVYDKCNKVRIDQLFEEIIFLFFFIGLKLGQEAHALSGPKLVDYKKVILEDKTIAPKVEALKKGVEAFSEQFPIPTFQEL